MASRPAPVQRKSSGRASGKPRKGPKLPKDSIIRQVRKSPYFWPGVAAGAIVLVGLIFSAVNVASGQVEAPIRKEMKANAKYDFEGAAAGRAAASAAAEERLKASKPVFEDDSLGDDDDEPVAAGKKLEMPSDLSGLSADELNDLLQAMYAQENAAAEGGGTTAAKKEEADFDPDDLEL